MCRTNLIELLNWARDYHKTNKYPCDFLKRFAIGFYQIYQGIAWKDNDNRYESFAAAGIHFLVCSEIVNLNLEQHKSLPVDLLELSQWSISPVDLLFHLSRAQQMLIYLDNKTTTRKSRYNQKLLALDLSESVKILFSAIPQNNRNLAINDAINIMTGIL